MSTNSEIPLADPGAGWWTMDDIAAFLGVRYGTVRSYRARGILLPHDRKFGRTPVWRPASVTGWAASRPGRGARTDLGRAEPGGQRHQDGP